MYKKLDLIDILEENTCFFHIILYCIKGQKHFLKKKNPFTLKSYICKNLN